MTGQLLYYSIVSYFLMPRMFLFSQFFIDPQRILPLTRFTNPQKGPRGGVGGRGGRGGRGGKMLSVIVIFFCSNLTISLFVFMCSFYLNRWSRRAWRWIWRWTWPRRRRPRRWWIQGRKRRWRRIQRRSWRKRRWTWKLQ